MFVDFLQILDKQLFFFFSFLSVDLLHQKSLSQEQRVQSKPGVEMESLRVSGRT